MRPLHYMAQCEVLPNDEGAFLQNLATLVEAGADINATTTEGETPLHYALWYGGVQTFAILLGFGGDLNYRTKYVGVM